MKAKIVFEDWRQIGSIRSIYCTELGCELSIGDLHAGTVFNGEISLSKEIEQEIKEAMRDHKAYPVFSIILEDD